MGMLPKLLIYRYQTRLKIKNPVIVRPPLIEYVCMIKNFNQSSMNYINQINMSRAENFRMKYPDIPSNN